jgi:hypothetical protein
MELTGTKGKITIEDFVKRYTFQSLGSEELTEWRPSLGNSDDGVTIHNLDAHITEICRSLLLGQAPPVPARCGLRALLLAYKIIESFESGRRVLV